MNDIIDYSRYNITSTSQFNDGLSKLKDSHHYAEINKLFKIIDEIIQGADMYEKEYARPLKNSEKAMHIHLDGRRTGDIILIYRVNGHDIDLDLRLHNITDHKNLDRVSRSKFLMRQRLEDFDVIKNKYSQDQLDVAEQCYSDLVSESKFNQLRGKERESYTQDYIQTYFELVEDDLNMTLDEFIQIVNYFDSRYNRSIYGSIDFSAPQHTGIITRREESYIMRIFDKYNVYVNDAYIESEVDEYGDKYEYMYVEVNSDSKLDISFIKSDLYSLDDKFGIIFDSYPNGLGRYGTTFQLSHYFE